LFLDGATGSFMLGLKFLLGNLSLADSLLKFSICKVKFCLLKMTNGGLAVIIQEGLENLNCQHEYTLE
jgi:hypothetical protein